MQLVEKHVIKKGQKFFEEIDALSFASKNLYNAANYIIRQNYIFGWGYLNYNKMHELLKTHSTYKALPRKVSQQILIVLDRNWKSFFKALQEYKVSSSAFKAPPQMPLYKDKTKGRNLLVYTIQAISKPGLKDGRVKLSGTNINLTTQVSDRVCQVRIVPKCDCYVIEVIYNESESTTPIPSDSVAAIDLGLNNLATLTSNQKEFTPLLINGRPLKSINQFFNKRKAALQSMLNTNRKTSDRIARLTRKRNQKIDNYLHHTSRLIVAILTKKQIGTLVIGKNNLWKHQINLGKRNNQNFVTVPYSRFIQMLTYKCQLVGIMVVVTEESYTSKSSFLSLDPIPTYGQETDSPTFSGQRISRGLYRTSGNRLINSDVNGSYNILRKAIPNAFADGIGSCVVQPRRISPLKVKAKGESEMVPKAM
ncbi:RNA-guided endonuclease InsQ/TnpB family protein [Scytonema sp. PCC 10023]|uniref:RNA-guided endonuclease InsQ/TnpB family protein n=1 Tax=Scytonema sp. PCC 10023 TaxID=1680591 RepID=UPI0039C62A3F